MRYDRLRRVLVVLVAGLLFSPTALFPQKNSSSVPPARFTSVKGKVNVKGPDALIFASAAAEAAIKEGSTVATLPDSRATVEFRDGSTIRLDELSHAVLDSLATAANQQNVVTLKQGFAAVHMAGERPDALSVKVSESTLTPHGSAAFEIAFNQLRVQLGVQAGAVTVAAQSRSITLHKGQEMTFDPLTAEELPTSHVRVVRLSFVSGKVTVKRSNASTWEKAMVNLPLQEGFELSTSGASFAEMQFENGSTARMGELSGLKIYELGLGASGDKLNGLELGQGYATFNFVPEQGDALHVKVGDATLTPNGKSEFRTDIAQDHYRVEVFKGSVHVAAAMLTDDLEAGKALERQVGSTELAFNIEKKITRDDWDRWTQARDSQAERTNKDQPVGASGMVAGWSDLDTYGEWVQIAGRGVGWSPYVPAGWSPYTMGNWGWYPGMGYTWISSEPWGWLPYHCGLWDFDASFGWYWSSPMNGCMFWQPALVNWYSGPGWVGWGPQGRGTPGTLPFRPGQGPGHPVPGHPMPPGTHMRLTAGSRPIVTVPTSVFQHQQTITPNLVTHAFAGPLARAGSEPSPPPAEQPATSIGGRAGPPGGALAAGGVTAATVTGRLGAGFGPHHSSAPASILMGGDPSQEGALLSGHYHHSGSEPLRAREGSTLGGHYNVRGSVGEFRGEAFRGGPGAGTGAFRGGNQGFGNGGISVSHQSGGGTPHGGWTGGSASGASGGGRVGGGSSGGGFGGGHSSAGPSGGGYSGGGGHSGGGGGFSGGGHSGGGGGFSGGGVGGGGHAGGGGGGASSGGGGGGGHH